MKKFLTFLGTLTAAAAALYGVSLLIQKYATVDHLADPVPSDR